MDVTWEAVIGLGAVPALLPVLVEHLKHAARRETPWPLVTDALAVAWVLALRDAGLLGALGRQRLAFGVRDFAVQQFQAHGLLDLLGVKTLL
ncbi:MAG: hypothetical protein CVU47_09170, partial [Chloroflexi bacterium HGW-Chloroflexi-9]